VQYVDKKEDPLIQVVRTHQHNTDSAVLQTARCLTTEVQKETRKTDILKGGGGGGGGGEAKEKASEGKTQKEVRRLTQCTI